MVRFHLYVGWFCGFDLKGHPAYKQQAGKSEKNPKYDTVTLLLVYHKYLLSIS